MCQGTECKCHEAMKDIPHHSPGFCHTPGKEFGRTLSGGESRAELEEYLSDLRVEVKEVEKLITQLKN